MKIIHPSEVKATDIKGRRQQPEHDYFFTPFVVDYFKDQQSIAELTAEDVAAAALALFDEVVDQAEPQSAWKSASLMLNLSRRI